MIVKLLTEHHLEAAQTRLSLHLSKSGIVGNLMHWLNYLFKWIFVFYHALDERPCIGMW